MKYRKIIVMLTIIMMIAAFWQLSSYAQVYYVDSINGNDLNDGCTENTPWQTLEKLMTKIFLPGDEILFKRGCTWDGSVEFLGSGEYKNPIKVSAYGEGERPVINGCEKAAISLIDRSYWQIEGLMLTNRNDSSDTVKKNGIFIMANREDCYDITVTDVEITAVEGDCSSFGNAGIYCVSNFGHFNGLRIEKNDIHDIDTIGIYLIDYQNNNDYNRGVIIRNNTITRNGRDGIIVTGAYNPLIEKNTLMYIGASGHDLNVIAGIFPTRCRDGIIQYNEIAYIVDTGDSYALDTDLGCEGVFYYQYNYSHHNAGGFYMQPQNALKNDSDRVIVRYNISLHERGGVRIQHPHVDMYNNVLYDPQNALEIGTSYTGGQSDINIYNNIFVSSGAPEYWYEFNFYNNLYYGHDKYCTGARQTNPETGKGEYIEYDIATLGTKHKNVICQDPGFISDFVEAPEDCRLRADSAAIGMGVDTPDVLKDYFGNVIYSGVTDLGVCSSDISTVYDADGNSIVRQKSTAEDISEKQRKSFYAADCDAKNGVAYVGNTLTSCDNGDWVCYKNIDFGVGMYNMYIQTASNSEYRGKTVKIKVDSLKSEDIGSFKVKNTGSSDEFIWNTVPLKIIRGVHDVYMVFGDMLPEEKGYVDVNLYGVGKFLGVVLE